VRAGAWAALLLALAGVAAAQTPRDDPRAIVGPPRDQPLSGAALETRTRQVAGLLRCPVCQGLSVADSPSATAQNMKAHVRELVAAGYDQDQILAYFERSYGEFVRLEPARRGVNWLVWIAPVAGLMLGLGVVLFALRAPKPALAAAAEAAPLPLPEDPRLAAYVLKVRELVHGWPGGRPPGPGSS